jgi:alpha-N-arabinofuranosidase
MITSLRTAAASLLLAATALATPALADTGGTPTTATLHADTPGPTYDARIFTQFAEHLGNGIYGGLWVGNDKSIPNTNGFRNDVVAALRELKVPVIRWPGGFCR